MKRISSSARIRQWRLARKRRRFRVSPFYRRRRSPLDFRVVLKGSLDLISNASETRRQLGALLKFYPNFAAHRSTVFIDVRDVVSLDPASMLYLVAQIDRLRASGFHVKGNYPKGKAALLTMHDAEFESYVGIRSKIKVRRMGPEKTLRIISGNARDLLDPERWLPLLDFLKQSQRLSDAEVETIYATLGECIENVRQHAFGSGGGRWYAVALRGGGGTLSRIVVLDLGIGIHKSIRKTTGDRLARTAREFVVEKLFLSAVQVSTPEEVESGVFQFIAMLKHMLNDEGACLVLATTGERTRTGTADRGTGLTGLREAVLSAGKGSLHVAAGSAMIRWTPGLTTPFRWTLPVLPGSFVCLDL